MTQPTSPNDTLVSLWRRARASREWPHRRALVYPPGVLRVERLVALHRALAPAAPLPSDPVRWWTCDESDDRLDEGYASSDVSGALALSRPRGFMPGVGQTLTYFVLVDDAVCVEVEDFWEDNVGDATSTTFELRARTEQGLVRAADGLASVFAAP